MVAVGQQALRRDFGARVHGTEVLGKVAHHAQPSGPVGWLTAGSLSGPPKRQLSREEGSLLPLGKGDEFAKFTACIVQFKPEAMA